MSSNLSNSLFAVVFSFFFTAVYAGPAEQQAFENFERAAAGDKAAVELAIEQFETLLKGDPQQPVYEARVGSLTTMQARDAWAPWKKMSYSEQGLERIDLALDTLTDVHDQQQIEQRFVSLDVRYTAAVTFSSLPRFFNRWGQAERILAEMLQSPLLAKTPVEFRASVWLSRARLAQQRQELPLYKEYLQKVIELAPNSKPGIAARKLLAENRSHE
ncbi:MAG: hypothetical protein OEX03_09470 [Gammaproteobacteria bacterium]|nr:hypothetical protein [Gammaproteobacteria bacterium]